MHDIRLFTIGFTRKKAEKFFTLLRNAGIKKLIDIRLNNSSQLAGFAKKDDLAYFLGEICRADYVHMPILAPTQDILDAYKKNNGDWAVFEKQFLALIKQRQIEKSVLPDLLDDACLLCSEDTPKHCHRRLVAEYLREFYPNIRIIHLL